MKKSIERILFWFSNGKEIILPLNKKYFALSTLLNRLLNEVYIGKKIKFFNIYFRSELTYELFPKAKKNFLNSHKGYLNYDAVFNFSNFLSMSDKEQEMFVWKRLYEIIIEISKLTCNDELKKAAV